MEPDIILTLTSEQIELIQQLVKRAERDGGMILGSVDCQDYTVIKLAVVKRQTALLIIGLTDSTGSK